MISKTPPPPYYAVICTSIRTDNDKGYAATADKMLDLAKKQAGFLGFETAREDIGISVSYWSDLDSIKSWKENMDHRLAQAKGKSDWYQSYRVRIAKVQRDYGFGD